MYTFLLVILVFGLLIYVVFIIKSLMFDVELLCVATLVKYFESMSCFVYFYVFVYLLGGFCITYWGVLYSLSGLCILCWGFVLSV